LLGLQVETSRACPLVDHIRHACVRPTHHLPAVAGLACRLFCFLHTKRSSPAHPAPVSRGSSSAYSAVLKERAEVRLEPCGRARPKQTGRHAGPAGTREAIGRNRTTRRTTTSAHASPRSLQARRRPAGGGVRLCVGLWRNSSGADRVHLKATDRPRSPPARRESEGERGARDRSTGGRQHWRGERDVQGRRGRLRAP
jgi:hypothetical protein